MVIKHNRIYDNGWHGIQFNGAGSFVTNGLDVRGNLIFGNGPSNAGRGIIWMENSDGGSLNNNTFYDNNTEIFVEDDCGSITAKNNILSDSRGWGAYAETGGGITLDYNLWNSNASGNAGQDASQGANKVEGVPQFTAPGSNDFTLQSTSLAIDAGVDLGTGADYEGLNCNLSTWPSSVVTVDQDSSAPPWDIGACVGYSAGPPPNNPILIIISMKERKPCPFGMSPLCAPF